MLEILRAWDIGLFLAINHLPHKVISDGFFGFVTAVGYGGVIWVLIAVILALRNKKIAKKLFTAVLWAEVLYFFLVEFLAKNYFGRLRPQFLLPDAILPYDFSRSFSFPSGHATIAFAAAYILSVYHRKFARWYYLFAALISFSRIYLGKHYPSDVLGGGVLGICIGIASMKIIKRIMKRHNNPNQIKA